ncbi:ATP-dependent helicase HrpB [Paenibacillus glycanilyticus]|uniref:ATP-dependent helicase HrpB n=1 Tax=Paenibacillus glycanilyticus TaxID=126569 RepID=A0ABQ6GIK0_9BACL|nr:ATP-dependent helicase HrpB [Paenibacillus glycanilyticus]GLX70764.1 ATP-dependent helicase HrpB [Paenibacillus glycanilyticus]
MNQLPIDAVLPEVLRALREGTNAVLIAEPGAGKTTRVPLALLGEPWLAGRKIIMLEPRRLAARSAAKFMAGTLGEKVGETVGYRVRLDTKVSAKTRIEVVTEGVLTRMLQEDQGLEQVGAVLFDEFHERHLHGDLGLALALQSQMLLREDLRLMVMSATLNAEPVSELLGGAPVIRSSGRMFPVETRYRASRMEGKVEPHVASTIIQAIREQEGDVLVFLPGVGEIRRTASILAQSGLPPQVRIAELHGNLSLEAQDAAVAPCKDGERKVVLATSIAESSLTVEGIRVVVDSGLMRVPRFSPRTGMTRLETTPVSQASADQRRGRAGRLAPGICYRLWTELEHPYLPLQNTPELLEADLAPLALELSVWGVADPGELMWLDAPPEASYRQARELLMLLHALDGEGRTTGWGNRIARLGLHPRLGFMLLKAEELNLTAEACELAALLSERDLLPQERTVDVQLRLDALHGRHGRAEVDRNAVQRIRAQAKQWRQMLEPSRGENDSTWNEPSQIGLLIALAYPDRIAQRRTDGRYLLANGRGAVLPELQPLSRMAFLAACELDDAGGESRIRLAAELQVDKLEQAAGEQFQVEEAVEWDAAALAVRARRRVRLGAILLKETPLQQPAPERIAQALADGIAQAGMGLLPMSKAAKQLQARMLLMARHNSSWPDVSEEALLASVHDWLLPHLYGMKNRSDLQKLNMVQLFEGLLSWGQRQELEEQVPTHMSVPSGSRIPIDYSDPDAPFIAVRLQELFGLRETPRLAGGRLPLTLHLLSPSQRPVQVTRDLRSFWNEAYFEVKKDLKGRYPKHYWPDDPYAAQPTNRVRPRN